jgi:hypothetical protein
MPSATNVITLDGNQTAAAVTVTTGSASRIVQIDNTGSTNVLTLLSADPTGSGNFPAINVTSGLLTVNSPIQLGDGTTVSSVATFNDSVNTSNSVLLNGAINEAAGQTWGVRIDGNNTANAIVHFAATAKSYSGDTTIATGGKLREDFANGMPNGIGKGDLVIEGSGLFSINNVDVGINALKSTSATAAVTKAGSSSKTLTIGNGAASGSYAGTINLIASGGTGNTLNKTGGGTETFGGALTLNTFNVTGGTALVNSTLSATTATSSTISSGATLGGIGALTLTGSLAENGNLAPGDSPGVLSIGTTNANFGATGSLNIEIGGNSPGNTPLNYDQLLLTNVSGTVTLNAATALNLSLFGGYTPNPSDIYYILGRADTGAFTTLFNGTTEGGTVNLGGGYTGQITYLANWTSTQAGSSVTGGNDVAIYNVVGVPEPSSLVLLGLAGMAFVASRMNFSRKVID